EVEREVHARRGGAAVERREAVVPAEEGGHAVATLVANGAEHVDGVDEAERDQRVAEAPVVRRELTERHVELLARDAPAAHEVLAEQLLALGGGHVVEPATVQVDLFAARAATAESALHEERARLGVYP